MKVVKKEEYPENREWNVKVFSIPKIPRGEEGQAVVLKSILEAIKEGKPNQTVLKFKGSDSKATLERLCIWLRPIGLVYKKDGIWKISDESKRWLETGDDLYLTAILCANIRFVGEILYFLEKPKKMQDLYEIAINEYHLNWKTTSEINNRLTWLRQLGLVDFQDYLLQYSLTNKGKEFVQNIDIIRPEEITIEIDSTINEENIPISDWAIEKCKIDQENLKLRKSSIGYIPGNVSNAVETFIGYLQLMSEEVTQDIIREYSKNLYGISVSSSNMFITLLNSIEFIDRKSRSTYKITDLGDLWLKKNNLIDLLCCLHIKFLFIFELLKELEEKRLSAKELAVIAKVSYGFNRENIDEIRKRIILFKEAHLIREDGAESYSLTERGKRLLKFIHLQEKEVNISNEDETNKLDLTEKIINEKVDSILTEARLASKDSSNPSRFEKAIRETFELLGFKAEWLGGPGKTDILLETKNAAKLSYKVTVDTKSTASGNVTEGLINFDTLMEHKKLHNADYTVVVGYSFQGDRLVKRALEHNVVLIDINNLEEIIRNHMEIPVQISIYRKIFSKAGLVNLSVLNDERNKIQRYGYLVEAIMNCLAEESTDLVTEGILLARDIYRSIRNDERFDIKPDLKEIEAILELLSSPLIECVGKTKEGYYALESLKEAGRKFEFYAKACLNE
ncbi:hypothetical protein [Clostridium mediterraneense]|uniref:hypothetical protein n=1 Tax=Clostridium mediterraneense TaxID=1805472 RepID=UPI000829B62E|nr:hypothetical protein [Clostridium mediterraneense]